MSKMNSSLYGLTFTILIVIAEMVILKSDNMFTSPVSDGFIAIILTWLIASSLIKIITGSKKIDANPVIVFVVIFYIILLLLIYGAVYRHYGLHDTLKNGKISHSYWVGLYFSTMTITTVGYGDVVPTSGPARVFATIEALTGYVILALTVAAIPIGFRDRQKHSVSIGVNRQDS